MFVIGNGIYNMKEEAVKIIASLKKLAEETELTYENVLPLLKFYKVKAPETPITNRNQQHIVKALTYSQDHWRCGYVDTSFTKNVTWKAFTTYDEAHPATVFPRGTMYLSIKQAQLGGVFDSIIRFLIDHQIPVIGKVSMIHQNITLILSFGSGEDATQVRNFIWRYWNLQLLPHDPFIPDYHGIGLVVGEEIHYQEEVTKLLVTFGNACRNSNHAEFITLEQFYKTLTRSYRKNMVEEPYIVNQILQSLDVIMREQ